MPVKEARRLYDPWLSTGFFMICFGALVDVGP